MFKQNLLGLYLGILFVINHFYFISNTTQKVDKCETCNKLVNKIIENLDKTSLGNFGGGNTDWEDRKLGSYLTSETRFEEVIENICDTSECHSILEEYEDYLFDWFKNKQKDIKNSLSLEFCVNTVNFCCPKDTYGQNCSPCPQNLNRTCTGNGNCDGSGTRKGSGKCKCNSGYTGDVCDKCKVGYFNEIKTDKLIKCTECHKSCKTTCLKTGVDGCVDCKDGWLFNEGRCDDINECATGTSTCKDNEYCENTDGSFQCKACNEACKKCFGLEDDKCIECNDGYERDADSKCVDVNECEVNKNICGEFECENRKGSYECKGSETKTLVTNEDESTKNTEL